MDAELRDLLMSTIEVRRPTVNSRSGGSFTLGTAVEFDAYGEVRDRYVAAGASGAQRVTEHIFVIDAVDVAASVLVELYDTDLFWIEGFDSNNAAHGRKPVRIEKYKDPDTLAVSHYEVAL